MPLAESSGTILADGTEQTIFDTSSLTHFFAYVFLHNMIAGDTLIINIYIKDVNGATMRLVDTFQYDGAQTRKGVPIPYYPTSEYKLTIQQTAGTNRNYTWAKYTT